MYNKEHLNKIKQMNKLAPEVMKAFWAFDKAAVAKGAIPVKYKELIAVAELRRVTRPGGRIALANWTPEGFIGKMFRIFKAHLPPSPAGIPSPMDWGNKTIVRARLKGGFTDVQLTRRMALMRYPFSPAETVEFFRQYYGPTLKAFASLTPSAQAALRHDLVQLESADNISGTAGTTEIAAEYLEVVARRN